MFVGAYAHGDCYLTDAVAYPNLRQGKYNEAEGLYRCIISITEKTFGTDHPDYSAGLNDLAGLLKQKVKAWVSLLFFLLTRIAQNVGPGATNTVALPNVLQGDLGEAERIYRRAMSITERTLGTGHTEYTTSLNNLARLQKQQVWARMSSFFLLLTL